MKLKSICFVMRRYDDFIHSESMMDLIHRQYQWTNHLIDSGVKIYYIHGSDKEESRETSVGRIYFVKDCNRTSILSHSQQFYKSARSIIAQLDPNLVVNHGLADVLSHYLLNRRTQSKGYTIIQDHANTYQPKFKLLSRLYKSFDAILFNSPGQGDDWIKNDVFNENQLAYIPEGTSNFKIDQKSRLDNLKNKQSIECLWVGNLDSNKDPITILKAIKILSKEHNIHLSMVYRNDQLINEVKTLIQCDNLDKHVTLLGSVNHSDLEKQYCNSHFILAGSGKEGSGYAVMEAMSCGVVPILTQIPSFIHFANNETSGFLYKRKDEKDLAKVINQAIQEDYKSLSKKSYQFFCKELSSNAIASKFNSLYLKLSTSQS